MAGSARLTLPLYNNKHLKAQRILGLRDRLVRVRSSLVLLGYKV
jgi:hypothetical protein